MADENDDVAETLGLGRQRHAYGRWIGYGAALVVAAGIGWYWVSSAVVQGDVRYETAAVERRTFDVIVTATGTVEPTNLVEISSELSGTLASVNVDYNDRVEVGTVLALLDTTKLEAQLNVRRAALDSAIARVAMARATIDETKDRFDTALSLQERGVASHQAFVADKAAFTRAQAELQAALAEQALAEANLDLQQADLDNACICSPIRGVVLDRAADPGQIVASALSAPILFTIAEDLTEMELQVDIDEADIGRIKVGDAAFFTVDAYDDSRFPAEIAAIRFAPETVDGVVTYKAILSIDNSDLLLRPGMTATADITVARIENAVTVPNAALRYSPPVAPAQAEEDAERSGLLGMLLPQGQQDRRVETDARTLWVLRDGAAQQVDIRAGATDGRVTEIVDGAIAEGDLVITDQTDA